MEAPLLALANAELGYPGHAVLRAVSLEVRARELVVVLGPNGSGKTTLLRSLLGLLEPLSGRIERSPGLRTGYVPQRETLDDRYPLSGADVARLGAWADLPFWRRVGASRRRRVQRALDECDALGFADRRYAELSGGQRQRILIARALATEPQALILDEPTAGVDAATERSILDALARLARERGLAVWIATHHEEALRGRAARVARVERGTVELEAGS